MPDGNDSTSFPANQGPEGLPVVFAKNGAIYASSRDVAERFEKRHADVLRTIEELDCSPEFRKRNFAFSVYRAEGQARTYPYVEMTRDGFAFLVMGFTGDKAAYWKERYIDAFNLMEAEIRKGAATINIDVRNPAQLTSIAIQLIEVNKELEEKVAEMAPTVRAYTRIAAAEGSLCPTDTGKTLGVRPRKMTAWFDMNRWTYHRVGHSGRLAYQDKIQRGLMEHKVTSITLDDGTEKITTQARITPKGLAYLAELFAKEGFPE